MNRRPLYRIYYECICRAYARYLGDNPADKTYRFLCSPKFWVEHRYWPHFKNPRTFSEKVWNRMLFDRDPRWTMISDKLVVRDYVTSKVGSGYLIPLLWNGDKPEEIPFDELPPKYVIKANHGCGYNIFVKDKTKLDIKNTIRQLKQWLGENFCYSSFLGMAWAYKNIKPTIIVETFLGENGKVPVDYKFFCYSGRVEFILMVFDRYEDPYEKHFNRDFVPLDMWNGCRQYPGKIERPKNYEEMIQVAESLSQGFDFIRVDLYNVDGRIYFGELTCYPAGGLARFIPRKYDFIFGEKWEVSRRR